MKRNHNEYVNKKIKVLIHDKEFYFTIKEVIDLTDDHIFFRDKFGNEKGFRFKDIAEIS